MQKVIGEELRRVRLSRKLSLRNVATAVGVSASLLSQVETGKTQPSVSTLYALARHLGVSLDALMNGVREPSEDGTDSVGDGQRDSRIIQRRSDNPLIEMENGVVWERLADGARVDANPLLVTYESGSASSVEGRMVRHDAVEYGVIIEGTLTLRIENDVFEIYPGDSFCFDANRLHLFENSAAKTARGIWFVVGNNHSQIEDLSSLDTAKTVRSPSPAKSEVAVLNAMADAKSSRPKSICL